MTLDKKTCGNCNVAIDWTGKDARRAPGLIEDGEVICRTCAYDFQRQYEPQQYTPPTILFSRQPGPDEGPYFDD